MAVAKLVPIDLHDGKERFLKLPALSIIRFEERVGKPIDQCLELGFSLKLAVDILWASLLWTEPTLTFEQAAEMVDRFVDESEETPHDLMAPLVQVVRNSTMYRNSIRVANGHEKETVPKVETEKTPPPDSSPTPTT